MPGCGATGGVFRCCEMMATDSSPTKGGRPQTISYSIAPSEYRSERAVTSPPIACSGGMYETVPTIMPACVSRDRSTATARPKSPILAVPSSVSHTLPGLRSRWTMPLPCANSRPRHVSSATLRALSRGSLWSPRLLDQSLDVAARQQWQHHVGLSLLCADVVDADDVRVVAQPAHRLRFARDALLARPRPAPRS